MSDGLGRWLNNEERKEMNRVFVDMDGVIVDFDAYKTAHGLTGDEVKRKPGAYLEMPPIAGAKEAVRSLIGMGFEVWIATKPPTGVPYAYSDKAAWVFEHLPELQRRIIVTHDKGLLGDVGDFLCDDRPHKANCEQFAGMLLRFVDGYHWPQALECLRTKRPNAEIRGRALAKSRWIDGFDPHFNRRNIMAEKEDKYFVLKLDDLAEYTTPEERLFLDKIANQIAEWRRRDKREPHNRYIVCNQDEPYAEKVWRAILNGEDNKGRTYIMRHKNLLTRMIIDMAQNLRVLILNN